MVAVVPDHAGRFCAAVRVPIVAPFSGEALRVLSHRYGLWAGRFRCCRRADLDAGNDGCNADRAACGHAGDVFRLSPVRAVKYHDGATARRVDRKTSRQAQIEGIFFYFIYSRDDWPAVPESPDAKIWPGNCPRTPRMASVFVASSVIFRGRRGRSFCGTSVGSCFLEASWAGGVFACFLGAIVDALCAAFLGRGAERNRRSNAE